MEGGGKTKERKKNLPPLRGKVLEWSIFEILDKKQFLRVRKKHFQLHHIIGKFLFKSLSNVIFSKSTILSISWLSNTV